MHDDRNLSARVEALERRMAPHRRGPPFLLGMGCALALVAAQSCAADTSIVRARTIEVLDDRGQVGMRLSGSILEVFEGDVARAKLAVTGGSAEMAFSTAEGLERASFGLLTTDPVLLMGDLKSEPELQLSVGRNGAGLWLRDRMGQTQADLSVTPHGTQLVLRDDAAERTFAPPAAALTE